MQFFTYEEFQRFISKVEELDYRTFLKHYTT